VVLVGVGLVVAGGVVPDGSVVVGMAGATFAVVRAPLLDVRADSCGCVVDCAAVALGTAASEVAGASGVVGWVGVVTGAGGRTGLPKDSLAVFVGVDGPAVASAMPSPDPEMITAVRIRNAARRRGSSRRWERITAPPPHSGRANAGDVRWR
jgi:hypothetical protein